MNPKTFSILPLVAAILLAGVALGTAGCTQSFSAGVSCTTGNAKGCTAHAGYTVQWANSCHFKKNCSKYGGMFDDFISKIGDWTQKALGIQEAFASAPGFDASQMRVDLSTTNVAITNSTGNLEVSLYNGQTLIAQQEFSYYRSGNSLYATDPGAINTWVSSYGTEYDSAQVSNVNNDLTYSPTTTAQVVATVATTMVYQGVNESTGSTSFEINVAGGGCGKIAAGCKQF